MAIRLPVLAIFVSMNSCTSGKFFLDSNDTDVGDTDAGDTSETDSVAFLSAETIAALPWSPELLSDAGISGGVSPRGFWVNDLASMATVTAGGSAGHVYRVPWNADGASIQEAADVTVTTPANDPRIVGFESDTLNVSGTDAGDPVIHRMVEPNESADISEIAGLTLTFDDSASTYWNQSGMMDADGDGNTDDLVIAGHAVYSKYEGRIATILDAPSAGHLYAADMDMVNACQDRSGSDVAMGAMSVVQDADGSFWVACASARRAIGYVEHRQSLTGGPDLIIYEVSGWSMAADPRGGVWLGAEGSGEVVYARTDGTSERYAMEGFPHFGSDPVLAQVGGRIVLAVGAMATSDALPSALYLYEITDTTDLDALTSNRLEPEGNVLCLGGVNGLVERSGGLYAASSGWILDTDEGCGIQMWKVGITP